MISIIGLQTHDKVRSQNSLRAHFGLNQADIVDELSVKWPRFGIVQKFANVAANQIVSVIEGDDLLVQKP
jgi:hypothetical protein